MNRDLTVGKPSMVLFRFCLPLFGSMIFQQLYQLADSLVAGRFIGENALAAVGNSYEVTLIFLAFAFGCNISCSVVASEFFGSKQYGQLKTAVTTTLIASGLLCLVLMAGGLLGCTALLHVIHTPPEIMDDSALYLSIYLWGLPFLFFYNIATGIFSALGDSRTPLIFLAFSSLANIAADVLFVTVFRMGVGGVAWATFLCQGISCSLALLAVFRRLRGIPFDGTLPLFSQHIFKKLVMIAVPSTLQQSFISVGNMLIQSVINGFGSGVIAGYSAGVKLNNLVITSLTTLGNGISNYTAQNLGAGKMARIQQGFSAGIRLIWILCIPLTALYFLFPQALLTLFMDQPTDAAMQTGVMFLRILSPFYLVISVKLAADGILRGAGKMKPFMIATFTDLILRVVLARLLSLTVLGATGIWCAWPLGWMVGTLLSLRFYLQGCWRPRHADS